VRAPILTLKRARRLRRKLTLPEILLWEKLRGERLDGLHFRRQHPIGPYILDFYCSSAHLAVEVDGTMHGESSQIAHDELRDRWLVERSIRVLRIPATDILNDERMPGVLKAIADAATAFGGPPPPFRFASRGRSLSP
jgi:very-short-patch-repair endonuclease